MACFPYYRSGSFPLHRFHDPSTWDDVARYYSSNCGEEDITRMHLVAGVHWTARERVDLEIDPPTKGFSVN